MVKKEAYGIGRPDVTLNREKWCNRSTWVWRDTGWQLLENKVCWADMHNPVVTLCPPERILVKYEEDETTPLLDAEEHSIGRKGFAPYYTKHKDGASVMMMTCKKGFKSDLLQKTQIKSWPGEASSSAPAAPGRPGAASASIQ